ncbi:MAG: hypothetical protein FWH06_00530 [Oscillospiraceae bacterium]|nr:hypothetical protein [Oscillospiraceae bacterium]
MDDIIRLLRRLSRQGVRVESMERRLRRGIGLDLSDLRFLRDILDNGQNARGGDILLSCGEWRTLQGLAGSAARFEPDGEISFFKPLSFQSLRVEPVMRVHRQNITAPGRATASHGLRGFSRGSPERP